jgi:hypothetical protein
MKCHSARAVPLIITPSQPGVATLRVADCSSVAQARARLRQGNPAPRFAWARPLLWVLWLLHVGTLSGGGAQAASPSCEFAGAAIRLLPLTPQVWWLVAEPADADADNRGVVSNALLVRDGPRNWLIGSGPSAAFGRALGCQVKALTGRRVSDVVSPWARPEQVLGAAGR